ncbi:hypothetical protein E7Q14_07580 [Campylobacter coli]|nr:hypothetical protein [Campylobacter coli]ECP5281107.1 hypothetical protein [Campylobacter lari]
MKRMAIQFFGHLRTYNQTYNSFFKNIVNANKNDGWKIDIFIHTWDRLSSSEGSWHQKDNLFDERALTSIDIENVKKIYNPRVCLFETLPEGIHGGALSKKRGNEIREQFQLKNNIQYNYILYTRPDVLFVNPLRLDLFLKEYEKYSFLNLNTKHVFCGNNFFRRMCVVDPRYLNEGDIIYISSHSQDCFKPEKNKDFVVISIDYALYRDFFLQRRDFILGWGTYPLIQKEKIIESNNITIKKQQESLILKDEIILSLKNKIINMELQKAILLKNDSSLNVKYPDVYNESGINIDFINGFIYVDENYSAVKRIKKHLSYKLGKIMWEYSNGIKSFPFVFILLYCIAKSHIRKNDSNLPPLFYCLDYNSGLEIKNGYIYSLGQKIIFASKTWHKLGLIKIWINVIRLKRKRNGNKI